MIIINIPANPDDITLALNYLNVTDVTGYSIIFVDVKQTPKKIYIKEENDNSTFTWGLMGDVFSNSIKKENCLEFLQIKIDKLKQIL